MRLLSCRCLATATLLLLLLMVAQQVEAWRHCNCSTAAFVAPSSSSSSSSSSSLASASPTTGSSNKQHQYYDSFIKQRSRSRNRADLVVLSAGGGFGGGSKQSKEKEKKLKPKQQWDRYVVELKKAAKVQVAARVVNASDDSEWLVVGSVKSKDNAYTKIAVVRQRALIAEHARRLYPLKVSAKDVLEYGYKESPDGDNDDDANAVTTWTMVDKSILESDDVPDNIEKMIGFEGKPDPNSGYYCVYNEGKLVNGSVEVKASFRTASINTGMTSPGKLRSGDK